MRLMIKVDLGCAIALLNNRIVVTRLLMPNNRKYLRKMIITCKNFMLRLVLRTKNKWLSILELCIIKVSLILRKKA